MSVFGIGSDLVEIARVASIHGRFGERFVGHLLMPDEYAGFASARRPERYLAMRFAAKEAVVKALGTGFANGLWIRDVGITQDDNGKPRIIYSDRGEQVRRRLGAGEGFVSLSDERGLALAVAVLERAL